MRGGWLVLLLTAALVGGQGQQQQQQQQQQGRGLLWYGDKDGLTSHLLQLRIMAYVARLYGRSLRVASIDSPHYGSRPMAVCDVFALPASGIGGVSCLTSVKPKASCLTKLTPAILASTQAQVCYRGPLPMIFGAVNRKQTVLRAMNLSSTPLQLQPKFGPWLAAAKQAMGGTFTAVHWRRGDQLKTRCSYNRDQSVNCANASALIAAVRKRAGNSRVYVATNEPSSSVEYKALQAAGFKVFASIKSDVENAGKQQAGQAAVELSPVDTFALEWALLVDATTFLGFGLTEIKDVVERERMLRNKTFCVVGSDAEDNVVIKTSETGTWCDVYSGNYSFFRTAYVETLWLGDTQNPNTSMHATAGGVLRDATGLSAPVLTGPAAASADAEDHRAAAKDAQLNFFQPLPKIKPSPGTAATDAVPNSRPKPKSKSRAKAGGAGANFRSRGAGDDSPAPPKHGDDLSALAAKVDPELLAHYQAVLQRIREAGRLEKKAFSPQLRVLVVAGLEGTGHHAMQAMLSVCVQARGPSKCAVDNLLDSLLAFTHNSREQLGLFFAEDAQRAGVLVAAIEASLRNISSLAENTAADNSRLYVLGLGYSDGVGMLSYPHFGGPSKTLNHPDVFILAAIAERVGIDLRVLVLQRSASEILRSTARRGFGGVVESRILVDNAAALYAQLRLLDPKFVHCVNYADLAQLRPGNGSAGSADAASLLPSKWKQAREALGEFLHPRVVPSMLDSMLAQISPSKSVSESLARKNMSANTALGEFQLESRLALIRDLCGAGGK